MSDFDVMKSILERAASEGRMQTTRQEWRYPSNAAAFAVTVQVPIPVEYVDQESITITNGYMGFVTTFTFTDGALNEIGAYE